MPPRKSTASKSQDFFRHWSLVIGHFLILLLLPACKKSTSSAQPTLTLNIVSPHGSDIRREFADAFSTWHAAHFGSPVSVQWVDIGAGGTGNVIKYLDESYSRNVPPNIDILFGGGSDSFIQLATKGFLQKPPDLVSLEPFNNQDPLAQVPPDIFGSKLHGPADVWIGATMSSFGFIINKQRIEELAATGEKIALPKTWEDLAGPDFIDRLSLTDPSKSGSVKTAYDMIFQQYGWEKGWQIMTLMVANSSVIRDGGSNPAEDVGSAEALAGVVIDFFGRLQVTRVGPSIAQFVIPDGGSTIDPDPIAMLKNAQHAELASQFIRFVVSPDGQRLWTFKPGQPGGPVKSALGRLSVLPSLYETDSQKMVDPANPFSGKKPLQMDPAARTARGKFFADLIKAALIDNQPALLAARKSIHQKGDAPDLLAQLTALPTFRPSTLNTKGELTYGPPRTLTESQVPTVANEFAPTDPAKKPLALNLQTNLINNWRAEMAQRLATLLK